MRQHTPQGTKQAALWYRALVPNPPRASASEISLVLLGCGAFLVLSPLRLAWAHPGRTWLSPFFMWVLLVGLAALAARGERGPRGPRE